jgi:hypothetical protein
VRQREEEIPPFQKVMNVKQTVRTFVKANSVFKDWVEDNENVASQVIDHDSTCWKLDRFVKDADDIPRIIDVMKSYGL